MSEEYDAESDLKLDFKSDGTVDLYLDPSGDIVPTGQGLIKAKQARAEIITQQLQLAFVTPLSYLPNPDDPNEPVVNFGTVLMEYVGRGDMTDTILKAIIIQTALTVPDVIGIQDITLEAGSQRNTIVVNLTILVAGIEESVLVSVVV
jgi:hypothetical protein